MNFKELDSKIYSVLFANNLNSIERYEKLRDLIREAYDKGFIDGTKTTDDVYQTLLEGDSEKEDIMFDNFIFDF